MIDPKVISTFQVFLLVYSHDVGALAYAIKCLGFIKIVNQYEEDEPREWSEDGKGNRGFLGKNPLLP